MATLPADRPSNAHTPEIRTGGSSLGELLRRARERRGLTLEQVATETKITRQHLEGLERGIFINVPNGFYQRAHIRTYARAVGLDPALALEQLDQQVAPLPPVVSRQPEPEPLTRKTPKSSVAWRKRALVAIGGVLVAVALGRAMGKWEPSQDTNPEPVNVPASVERRTADGVGQPAGQADPTTRVSREESSSASAEQAAPSGPALVSDVNAPRTTPADLTGEGGTSPSAGTSSTAGGPPAVETSRATRDLVARAADAAIASTPNRSLRPPAEPIETPAAPSPVSGLVVVTSPAGARVTVNGIAWGVTPVTIRYLPTGDKRIRVSKDGFAAQERTVRLDEGRSTKVDIQLQTTR